MYRKVGDWLRILRILNAGGAGNASEDTLRMEAYSKVGDYYADRQKW
uniref:SusD_RagB domain-containing protein n=1 Tax=Heterorhabditis bacteriophora TaxID=37862 RepID=A0A1I7X434_HETBA